MDDRDTIIIAISIVKSSEEKFLINCCRWKIGTAWDYGITNGTDSQLNNEVDNYSFVLINPASWGGDNVKGLLSSMASDKKKILWFHKTNKDEFEIDEDQVALIVGNIEYPVTFGHKGGKSEIEEFMRHISKGGSYKDEFKKLVEASLKKTRDMHLPSLLLLLPLDINLQALDILLERKDEANSMQYLKQMLAEAEEKHYTTIFAKVRELEGRVTDGKIQGSLKQVLGNSPGDSVLYGLLEHLDYLKSKVNLIDHDDVHSVSNYFRKTSENKYQTFHLWYKDLARCLRGRS